MRALLLCLIGLTAASLSPAFAQMKLSPKSAPGASETRYFTSIDGLMDGNADVILKETRQGKTVTAAVLDVCYPAEKGSERKDRFVANLAVSGQNLTGTTQSLGDKLPVTVKLVRKPTGDSFRVQGTDQRRPDRDGSCIARQFRSQRAGIQGQPVDRRQHRRRAKGFYRGLSGIGRGAGETRRGAGFPEKLEGAAGRGVAEQPHRLLRRVARRRADHHHQRRSGSRRGIDRESEVVARRGRRGLDRRRGRHGTRDPLCRRRNGATATG